MAQKMRLTTKRPSGTSSKFKGVLGDLDNAVRQAEERHLEKLFIVDADCHQDEPFSLFTSYMDEKWRRLADKHSASYSPQMDPFVAGEEARKGVGRYTADRRKTEEARYLSGRLVRPDAGKSPTSPEQLVELFAGRMHDIGIKRSIVLPTYMLGLGFDPNLEFEVAASNAYIDYMADHFLGKYPEILTLVYAPLNSPEKTAELIERVGSTKGIVGVMVTAARNKLAGEPSCDPVYEAAQRKGLPICIHAGSYFGGPFAGFDQFISLHSLSFPFYLMLQLTSVVMEGVPERFPGLKFCFMEGGLSWIPWLMHRLDSEYIMRRTEAPLLKKLPSQYINDFYYTTQPLEHPRNPRDQAKIFSMFDAENRLMYASDYPHWDFDVPSVVYDLPFLSKRAKKKILGENAAGFFGIS